MMLNLINPLDVQYKYFHWSHDLGIKLFKSLSLLIATAKWRKIFF